jgi:hypothetical protein
MGDEKNRVSSVNERIGTCRAKIDTLRGSTRAITILSTAKYPAPKMLPLVKTLFHDRPFADAPPLGEEEEDETQYLPPDQKRSNIHATGTADIMDLFSRVNPPKRAAKAEEQMDKEGLGRLPAYVPSVASVLLFNSSENPYHDYTTKDNLEGTDREKKQADEETMAMAPATLVDGDILPEVGAVDFGYKPAPKPHQEFALPANLALPNIADVQWSVSQQEEASQQSIAPSAFVTSSLPSLPAIEMDPAQGSIPTSAAAAPAAPAAPPPPPPPPSAPAAPPPPAAANAPPPPPPPTATAPPAAAPAAKPPPKKAAAGGGGGRGGLLAAIAAGRKLKPKNSRPIPVKVEPKKAANTPLTLAEEMKQRMKRRQDALSGKKDAAEQQAEKANRRQSVAVKAVEVKKGGAPGLPKIGEDDDGGGVSVIVLVSVHSLMSNDNNDVSVHKTHSQNSHPQHMQSTNTG